jgi:predicted DNA-binding protein
MTERLQRTQILLEPEQHEALTRLAAEEGRSLSSLVREAVEGYLITRERDEEVERRLAALETIRQHVAELRARHGGRDIDLDPTDIINENREERDREILDRLRHRD